MNGKGLIWMGMFVGSFVGSLLPYLWGGGLMAYTILGGVGGVAGICLAFKLGQNTGAL